MTQAKPKPKPLRLCFVIPGAYGLFDDQVGGRYGGAELRAWLFARALAENPRYDVHLIVYDFGQTSPQQFGALKVHANPALSRHWSPRLAAIRPPLQAALKNKPPFLQPTKLYPAFPLHLIEFGLRRVAYQARLRLRQAHAEKRYPALDILGLSVSGWSTAIYTERQADVYLLFGIMDHVAEVIALAQTQAVRTLFFATHDRNFTEDYRAEADGRDWLDYSLKLGYYSLSQADEIVVQTAEQAQTLAQNFGRKGHLIKNPMPLDDVQLKPYDERQTLLWVGRSHTIKQPQRFLDLARALPDLNFTMVMNRSGLDRDREYNQVLAHLPPNIRFYEHLPLVEIEKLFADARAFISTAQGEGLPNTFLQAAKYAVPILSLNVDPDQMLSEHDMGRCAGGDFEQLSENLRWLMAHPQAAAQIGLRGRAYVEAQHELKAQSAKLAALIESLCAKV